MRSISRNLTVAVGLLLAGACSSGAARDLDRAILLEGQRQVTAAGPAAELAWQDLRADFPGRDTMMLIPNSVCFLGSDLLVADGAVERIDWFDAEGGHVRSIGRDGEGPGEFRRLEVVRCRDDGTGFMAVDAEEWRIQFFDGLGRYVQAIDAPPIPQAIPYVGEFALATDGRFADSWLSAQLGPYLEDPAAWDDVGLVRVWDQDGEPEAQFGEPVAYEDPVLRRVFNHVSADFVGDTLWLLTQADATLRGYDAQGRPVAAPVALPVYHRGVDPIVKVGRPIMHGFRSNKAVYQPNVKGLAALSGGRFAVLRFRDWSEVRRGEGKQAYQDFWPESFLDVVDRHGRVEASYTLPGRASAVTSDKGARVAVITEDFDTGVRTVLSANLPGVSPRAFDRPVILAAATPDETKRDFPLDRPRALTTAPVLAGGLQQ